MGIGPLPHSKALWEHFSESGQNIFLRAGREPESGTAPGNGPLWHTDECEFKALQKRRVGDKDALPLCLSLFFLTRKEDQNLPREGAQAQAQSPPFRVTPGLGFSCVGVTVHAFLSRGLLSSRAVFWGQGPLRQELRRIVEETSFFLSHD